MRPLILVSVVSLAVLPATAHAVAGSTDTSLKEIREVLARRPGTDKRSEEDVIEALARLGSDAIPQLFRLYTGKGLAKLIGQREYRAQDWWCPADEVSGLAFRALGHGDPDDVLSHLRSQAGASAELDIRLAGVRLAGELGSSEGVPFVLGTAGDIEPKRLRYRSVRGAFVDSLAAILTADSEAVRALEKASDALSPELVELAIEAVGSADRPAATRFLVSVMGRSVELDLAAIDAAAELASRYPWQELFDPRPAIRDYMNNDDPRLRSAAVVAIARLADVEAFEDLIVLLEDENAGVRRTTQWSLRRLSGETRLDEPDEWTRWLELERRWWSTEGARLRYDLTKPDAQSVRAAVRELASRPLHKSEVALEIGAGLVDLPEAVATELCLLLAELDSPVAVPYLVDVLFQADGALKRAAWSALKTLTGQDLPPEPALWEDYTNG